MSYSQPPPANDATAPDPLVTESAPEASTYSPPPEVAPAPPYSGTTVPYGGSVAVFTQVHPGVMSARSTTRWLWRAVVAFGVLPSIIGGVVAFAASQHTNGPDPFTLPSIGVPTPTPGTLFGDPVPITSGAPFTIGQLSYAGGWRVGKDQTGEATIAGLRATNRTSAAVVPAIEFTLTRGGATLATITCALASIDPGKTMRLFCVSPAKLTSSYDTIAVKSLI